MAKRIITTENLEEDKKIENHLRPQLLKDYIGHFQEIQLSVLKLQVNLLTLLALYHVVFVFLLNES